MIGIIIGFLSGILAGMGMGGGIIMIPALVLILHASQHVANGVNLLAFIPAAAAAVWMNWKKGLIDKESLKIYLPFGIIGAAIGAVITVFIKEESLRVYSAVFLLILGIYMLIKSFTDKNKK